MNAPDNNQEPANAPWDPVFLESRREALVILLLWVAALLWAVPYCYLNGFPETFVAEEFSTVWGIPSWLFWGDRGALAPGRCLHPLVLFLLHEGWGPGGRSPC